VHFTIRIGNIAVTAIDNIFLDNSALNISSISSIISGLSASAEHLAAIAFPVKGNLGISPH